MNKLLKLAYILGEYEKCYNKKFLKDLLIFVQTVIYFIDCDFYNN